VSSGVAREIAALLDVPPTDIAQVDPAPSVPDAVRLQSCGGKGGLAIMSGLGRVNDLKFAFQVDPDGEIASKISDVIRFCQHKHINSAEDWANITAPFAQDFNSAAFIEAVGELNTKIAALYSQGVNLYFAFFSYWTGRSSKDKPVITFPTTKRRLLLLFSDKTDALLTQATPELFETMEWTIKFCHQINRRNQVSIEDIKAATAHSTPKSIIWEYVESYVAFLTERGPYKNVANGKG
jgi:hypothetical protein